MPGLYNGASGLAEVTGLNLGSGLSYGQGLTATAGPLVALLAATGALPAWLSHSRAGGAMMTDSTGKLTWAPENLLTYSNDFSNVSWVKSVSTLGANGLVYPSSTGNQRGLYKPTTSSVGAITSIEAKPSGINWVTIAKGNGTSGAWFNLATGTVGTVSAGITAGIAATSDGYYRIWIADPTTTNTLVTYFVTNGDNTQTVTANGTDGVLFRNAQYERVTYETTPRAYNPTTSAAYYGPRFDYDPSTLTALGLLLEGARTNVVLWNRDLTNAAWTKTNITAAKDQTGIDGVTNSASKITATVGNGTILQAITLASSARFQSAYVKRVTGSGVIEMTMDNGVTWTAITVTADWTRVSIPTQTLANPTVGFRIVTSGDAIAVDMVQNENGTFASSPILTTTAAVTRASDVCRIIGAALSVFSSDYGAVVVQFRARGSGSFGRVVAGSTISNSYAWLTTDTLLRSYNGTSIGNVGNNVVSSNARVTFAWNKITPSRRIQSTGSTLASASDDPTIDAVSNWLGSIAGNSDFLFGWFQSLAFYNQNLSDAALASKLTVDGPY